MDLAFLPSTKPTTMDRSIFVIRLSCHTIGSFLQHCLICASHAAFCSLRLFRQSTDAHHQETQHHAQTTLVRGGVSLFHVLAPFTSLHCLAGCLATPCIE